MQVATDEHNDGRVTNIQAHVSSNTQHAQPDAMEEPDNSHTSI